MHRVPLPGVKRQQPGLRHSAGVESSPSAAERSARVWSRRRADNFVLVYGDLHSFVIADRVGASFELIPHMLGPNRRPVGARGLWLWLLTGSDLVVENGVRVLNVAPYQPVQP